VGRKRLKLPPVICITTLGRLTWEEAGRRLNGIARGMPSHIIGSAQGGSSVGKHARVGLLLAGTCCLLAVMVDWIVEEL
jgi:hypothetical protein